jgi:hypothetical protein
MFRKNILKEKKNLLAFKKTKKWRNRAKSPKNLLILKETKKGKQSNEKETKSRILLLELIITRKINLHVKQKKGKENKLLLKF